MAEEAKRRGFCLFVSIEIQYQLNVYFKFRTNFNEINIALDLLYGI